MLRIAVDIMGGETPPEDLFQGVLQAAKELPSPHKLLILATKEIFSSLKVDSPFLEFVEAPSVITMEDAPLFAARRKQDSSLCLGLKFLKEGKADAFVTTGNTGALVVSAHLQLPTLLPEQKPGLLASLPSRKGSVALIDVGANVRFTPESLRQFALMGSAYHHLIHRTDQVKVGLLNIGVERKKGSSDHQKAFSVFQDFFSQDFSLPYGMEFVGNIEARDVLEGSADVVVSGGFTGNIFLKSIEGTSAFIFHHIEKLLGGKVLEETGLISLCHHNEYPGAVLCGLEHLVIKNHGNSSAQAFCRSIKEAFSLTERGLLPSLKEALLYA